MMTPSQSGNSTLVFQSAESSFIVNHDGFTIGSSPRCDFTIAQAGVASLHCVIHLQNDAAWIEAGDDQIMLEINGRTCRRMALRQDDVIQIGSLQFTTMLKNEIAVPFKSSATPEDLSLLTAEELCDRILSEQSMVDDFIGAQRAGWEALVRAIKESHTGPAVEFPASAEVHPTGDLTEDQKTLDQLICQIEELNLAIAERTQKLSQREQEMLESTSILDDTHREMSQRIETLMDQLSIHEDDKDLRASA